MKETNRQLDEKLGKLDDHFGEMIEYNVMPEPGSYFLNSSQDLQNPA